MKKIFLSLATLLSLTVFVNAQNSSPYWSLAGNSNGTTSSKLGTTNAINLRLFTNNLERMRISTSGLVGIGTATPTDRLHVNSASGTNAFRAQVGGYTKLLVHSKGGVSVGTSLLPPPNGLYVSGSTGIGTNSPSAKLHVYHNGSEGTAIYAQAADVGLQASGGDVGVSGTSDSYGGRGGAGVYGSSDAGYGVYGTGNTGVMGYSVGVDHNSGEGSSAVVGTHGADGQGVRGISHKGSGGSFSSNYGTGLFATSDYGTYAGSFYGKVYASAGFTTSDKNLKKNIQEFEDAISIINKLKPQNYEFKNDAKFASLHLPAGRHYGLMAQELEQVLPNLVSEGSHKLRNIKPIAALKPGADRTPLPVVMKQKETEETIKIKAVNYTELIPIIIKAMQEQQATIESQNAKIESLTQLVNKLSQNAPSVKLTGVSLGQSTPNPNSTNTRIRYNIPTDFSRAELVIANEAGQKVKQLQLNKSSLIDIDTSRLSAGTYFYTLYVNGTSVATKKMIVNR